MPRGKRVPSFLLIFLALPSINADVVSLVQKGMSLEFLEAQIDINEIVPDYDDEYESSSNFSTIARRPLGGAMEDFETRMNRDDKAILAALKSIEDMGKNSGSLVKTIRRAPEGLRRSLLYKLLRKRRLCPDELRWSGAQASNLWAGRLAVVRFHLLGVFAAF